METGPLVLWVLALGSPVLLCKLQGAHALNSCLLVTKASRDISFAVLDGANSFPFHCCYCLFLFYPSQVLLVLYPYLSLKDQWELIFSIVFSWCLRQEDVRQRWQAIVLMLGRRMGRGFKMVKYRSPAVNGKQFTLTQGKLQVGGGGNMY